MPSPSAASASSSTSGSEVQGGSINHGPSVLLVAIVIVGLVVGISMFTKKKGAK